MNRAFDACWNQALSLDHKVRWTIGPTGWRNHRLQRKKLRSRLAHHPIAEKRSPIRHVHQCLGAIHVPIGSVHQLEPEAAEAVRVPNATLKIEVPGLKFGEVQSVLFGQVRVQPEMQRSIWGEIELLQLPLDLRIKFVVVLG